MIEIVNKSDFEAMAVDGESVIWYDATKAEDFDGVFFVGTIKAPNGKAFLRRPSRRIVVLEKQGKPKGKYTAMLFDRYLKFANQGNDGN